MAISRNKKYQKLVQLTAFLLAITFLFHSGWTQAALNNQNIISDYNFNNSNPMSAAEINSFLAAKGSKLADYTIPENIDVPYPLAAGGFGTVTSRQVNDVNGNLFYGKTVAQLIYDESVEHSINPRVILATLEKESSAITGNVFRSSTVGAWPMFYMYDETMADCLNSGTNCNDSAYRQTSLDYGGIGRQLGYAIGWFGKKYYDYTHSGRCLGWNGVSCTLGYEQYNDPITIDGQSIVSQTVGTRILYLYTPHVQTSFYNIFTSFFGDPAAGAPPSFDIAQINLHTYSESVHFSGSKLADSKAYFRSALVADTGTTAWDVTFSPAMGEQNDLVLFMDSEGTELARRPVKVVRHKVADIDGDSVINGTDLSILASFWGSSNPSNALVDLDTNGVVDGTDLSIFAANWNK